MNSISILSVSLVCLLATFMGDNASASWADVSDPSELKLTTDRVVVFKDGYCLVVKQGLATTDADGVVFTDEVPDAAVLGSFWAVPDEGTIKSMVAGWIDTESKTNRPVSCTNVVEIIKANLGKHCSFELDDQKLEGVLLKVLSNDDLDLADLQEAAQRQSSLRRSSVATSTNSTARQITTSKVTGAYFILRSEGDDIMVSTSAVENLTIKEMTSTLEQTVTEKSRHKRLSMNFGEPNTKVKINLMYFRPDVRWIPTYRVGLTNKPFGDDDQDKVGKQNPKRKTAEILMQGEILNEAEDFIDVPFHVVVGVPNFRFRSIPSPLVLESSMVNLLAQAAPAIMSNMSNGNNKFSNALYTQRSSEFHSHRAMGQTGRAAVDLPAELTTKSGNDLFVYELDKMTLKKGERASVPILRTTVAYRDIYTWDVNVTHTETYAASSADAPSPLVLTENKVWRQVELINDTDIPWTTGAAMFVDGLQPLAQELLTYTSPGGICRIPVTISVDLRGKVEDKEVNRELKALHWRGNDYARIRGETNIELANNKTEPVTVEIRLRFGGKAKSATDEGEITLSGYRAEDWKQQNGYQAINNSSSVRWTTKIEPGECFKPQVDYEFLLRY